MQKDILLNTDKGYFDLSFNDSGDFNLTSGLETAIEMSLFVDKKASFSEMPDIKRRRGWFGNRLGDWDNYEIGSKLWLLSQARNTQNTLNLAKTYVFDSLQWMMEDQLVTKIDVDSSFVDLNGIRIDITFYRFQNSIYTTSYILWQDTGEITFVC